MAAEGAPTDAFYVLVSGRARVVKRSPMATKSRSTCCARATVSAKSSCSRARRDLPPSARAPTCWRLRLDAADFRALVDSHPDIRTYLELQLKHARLQAFFRHVPAFARLPPAAVAGVVLAELEPVALNAGDIVYRQGDRGRPDVPDRRRPAASDALTTAAARVHVATLGRRRDLRRRVGAARHARARRPSRR